MGNSNPASGYMGMANDEIVNLGIISVNYRDLTMDYGSQSRNNLAAVANGNRITQVFIPDLKLSSLVDDIVNGLSVNQICATGAALRCSILANDDIANLLLPALRGDDGTSSTNGIKDYVKRQLEGGLGLTLAIMLHLKIIKCPLTSVIFTRFRLVPTLLVYRCKGRRCNIQVMLQLCLKAGQCMLKMLSRST